MLFTYDKLAILSIKLSTIAIIYAIYFHKITIIILIILLIR